jgi:hypothetical protein
MHLFIYSDVHVVIDTEMGILSGGGWEETAEF